MDLTAMQRAEAFSFKLGKLEVMRSLPAELFLTFTMGWEVQCENDFQKKGIAQNLMKALLHCRRNVNDLGIWENVALVFSSEKTLNYNPSWESLQSTDLLQNLVQTDHPKIKRILILVKEKFLEAFGGWENNMIPNGWGYIKTMSPSEAGLNIHGYFYMSKSPCHGAYLQNGDCHSYEIFQILLQEPGIY